MRKIIPAKSHPSRKGNGPTMSRLLKSFPLMKKREELMSVSRSEDAGMEISIRLT